MYTILIADDEVNIVQGLCHTMKWEEHECQVAGTAFDGQEARKLALELKPDIIITDITMPKINGLDLTNELKETLVRTSFIVLTCHEDFTLARDALRLGVCDYILKETMTREELYRSLEKAKKDCLQKREFFGKDEAEIDSDVLKMTEYIKEHLSQKLTLDELAEFMAMNPSYFSRFFKNKMGENFVDYLMKIRIQFAMDQLRRTNYPIDMIAEQAGYINQSYFNTAFKKVSGTTPSKYRKEYRNK